MDLFPGAGIFGKQPPEELTNFHPASRQAATEFLTGTNSGYWSWEKTVKRGVMLSFSSETNTNK